MGWVARRWTHVVFVLVVTVTTLLTTTAQAPALAGRKVPGIDVSRYQGRIDWSAVATTPVRFVIMRATLGNRFRDERYRRNLSGATAHGLVVGAYHFAKPGRARHDARAEADHFLRVSRVAAGDLLPVLDIEETGGLGPKQLRTWARAWLERVRLRTGVRPMIYSGSRFWHGFMRNTSWFARRGHPLWVAHWYVGRPDVPARRWAGKGYTVWQWSATGSVAGIKGDVDRNWVRGSLRRGRIASIAVDPAAGGTIAGRRIECGITGERCVRLANPGDVITLRATPSPGSVLKRWTGACAPAGDAPRCTVRTFGANEVSAIFGSLPHEWRWPEKPWLRRMR